MILSFYNKTLLDSPIELNSPTFLSSYILSYSPLRMSHFKRLLWPRSSVNSRCELSRCLIRWLSVGLRSGILNSAGRTILLENPKPSHWKHVIALHCRNSSIIFWHESICDSDSRSLGSHKEMECPCFATSGFTVTAIYPVELLDMQSF